MGDTTYSGRQGAGENKTYSGHKGTGEDTSYSGHHGAGEYITYSGFIKRPNQKEEIVGWGGFIFCAKL